MPLNFLSRWALWPILLLLLAVAGKLHAEQASLREFGPADGLESLAGHAAVQDAEGFLWVGTENGLYRFDGGHFRRIGAEQGLSWINALAPQADGLWVGTPNGLWWLRHGKLVSVPLADGTPLKVFGPGALAPGPDQTLWVATRSGLYEVSPQAQGARWHARQVLALNADLQKADSVVALPDHTLWFSCEKALCRLRNGHVERFGTERGVPTAPWDWLIQSSDGSLWARGGQYLLQLAPDADRFVQHPGADFESDVAGFYPLVEDAHRRILTTTRDALLRWDGQRWERFGADSGLNFHGRPWALVADREGGLWLGAGGTGLLQWRGYGQWENWSTRDGLPSDEVWRFVRAGQDAHQPLFVGTGKGVAVLDPKTRRFRALASNASGAVDIGALAVDAQGALWAGTWGGQVIRYAGSPPRRGTVEAKIQTGDTVYGLLPDAPHEPRIVGLRQLYSWQPRSAGSQPQPLDEGLVGKGGFDCACRDRNGQLWVGSAERLLSQHQGRWVQRNSGVGEIARIACLHDGSLLVSNGYRGIHRLEPEAESGAQAHPFRSTDFMPTMLQGRQVLALLEDRRGWWWVATDAGVAVFNGQHWRWLDQQAGLVWSDTTGDGLYEDVDGSVWIGTSRGASHLLVPDALFEPIRGQVVIEEVRSAENTFALPVNDSSLSFEWTHDVIEVPLSAPVYHLRSAMRIEYRVTGFDERWTAAPADAVRLTGLPPGSYRFEARMIDRDLGVASPASGFGFEIAPPWWRTPPAYAVAICGIFVVGWLAHRWRVRQMRQHAAALEVLVRQRTQELEASREQLLELATRDALTGAWNRRALMDILAREIGRARRERLPLTLLVADIDHFKRVNDSFGHPVGDAVLREFVKRLTLTVRPYDAVARFGGEEFLIVMPGLNAAKPGDAQRVLALHAVIAAEPMPEVGRVTCSFGAVTLLPGMEADAEQLIAMADKALYRAKENGRDQVVWA